MTPLETRLMSNLDTPKTPSSNDFKKRLRGYDPNEVEAALGIMRSRIAELEAEIASQPEIVLTETRHARRKPLDQDAPVPGTWFEKQWHREDDSHLDDAFNEFFIGADVVRTPWKNRRRKEV